MPLEFSNIIKRKLLYFSKLDDLLELKHLLWKVVKFPREKKNQFFAVNDITLLGNCLMI